MLVSLVFYFIASPKYIFFLLFSAATTFYAAGLLQRTNREKTGKRKGILFAVIFLNIGLLAFLKFGGAVFGWIQSFWPQPDGPFLQLILPLGISFYTLQVVGYCVDIYRGKYAAETNFAKYLLFVSFFPQIVQGPIARYDQLAAQFTEHHPFDYTQVKYGVQLMLWGFFKKMVIADRAALLVNQVFSNYQDYTGFSLFVASVFYSIQIYTDFSGCVDIARGAAQIFGIKLAHNFNHPYFALSIQDFWRRWHISLSTWLRDYIYIPLGGNRKGRFRKYQNILATFLVSGLWHGVGWQYIVWGALHGLYQVVGSLLQPLRDWLVKVFSVNRNAFSHKFFKGLVTFNLVNFAWIFFRSSSLTDAVRYIKYMFSQFNPWIFFDNSLYSMGLSQKDFSLLIVCAAVLLVVSLLQRKMNLREKLDEQGLVFRWSIDLIAIFSIIILGIYGIGYTAADFIYAQF